MSETILPSDLSMHRAALRERGAAAQALEDHVLLTELADDVRASVLTRGRFRRYAPGAVLSDDEPMVRFVLSGALGTFAAVDFLCLTYFGPGAVSGLEAVSGDGRSQILQVVAEAEVFELSARALVGAVGRKEAERMLGVSATKRLAETEAELTCLATYGIGPRLARWLLRLHALNPGQPVVMSQERLAQLLGAQRTSVNAAAHPLQAQGIVRYRRGRISVLDPARLVALACCPPEKATSERSTSACR